MTVRSTEETSMFYIENFGFEFVHEFTKPGWDGHATIIKLGEVKMELFEFAAPTEPMDSLQAMSIIGIKHFSLGVEDLLEKHKELKSKGVDIDEPVSGTTCKWYCYFRDPNGIVVELIEE